MGNLHKWQASSSVVLAIVMAFGAAGAMAATINVPADWPTIQQAIDHASPGDTVLVAPGLYDENVVIHVPNLGVKSSGGPNVTTIYSLAPPAVDLPIVRITADGVILGSMGGGFTIAQTQPGPAVTPHAGNAAVMVQGGDVGPAGVQIVGNTLRGNASDEGVLVSAGIGGGRLVLRSNTFDRVNVNAPFSFRTAIYVHTTDFGGTIGAASLLGATVEVTDTMVRTFGERALHVSGAIVRSTLLVSDFQAGGTNNPNTVPLEGIALGGPVRSLSDITLRLLMISNVQNAGVNVAYITDGCTVDIGPGSMAGRGTTGSGVMVDDVEAASTLTITGVNVSGFGYEGIRAYSAEDGGVVTIDGCTVAGGTVGIWVGEAYDGGTVFITNNTASGVSENGIELNYGADYGSEATIQGNQVTAFGLAGIHVDEAYAGSTILVDGNDVTGPVGGAQYGVYGGYIDYDSMLDVTYNTIANIGAGPGGPSAGIHVYESYSSSHVNIQHNTVTSSAAGGHDGVYMRQVEYGGHADISSNDVSGFIRAGLYLEQVRDAGQLTVTGNQFDAAQYGVLIQGYSTPPIAIQSGCTVEVRNNVCTGFANDGVACTGSVLQSVVTVAENELIGGSFGINVTAPIDEVSYVAIEDNICRGPTSAGVAIDGVRLYSRADLNGNEVYEAPAADGVRAAQYGIDVGDDIDIGSTVNIVGNVLRGHTYAGVHLYDPVNNGSVLTVADNSVVSTLGPYYGIQLDYYVEYGSAAAIRGNLVEGFTESGIFVYDVYEGGSVVVENNTVSSDAQIYDGGIYVDYVEYNSTGSVVNNTVTCSTASPYAAGIWVYDVYESASATLADNTVSGPFESGYVVRYVEYDSTATMTRCDAAGFTTNGLYVREVYDNSSLAVVDSALTGGLYGIYSYYEVSGGHLLVDGANLRSFADAGIHFRLGTLMGSVQIEDCQIVGLPDALAGIRFGPEVEDNSTVLIQRNCIASVADGVQVDTIIGPYQFDIHQCDLGDTNLGVNFLNGAVGQLINAESNWWGTPNAPGVGGSSGVSAFVDYAPWLTTDPQVCVSLACPGDGNCDGVTNWRDVDFFVAAISGQAAWEAMFAPGVPTCPYENNDVNVDSTVNWRDIDPLVAVMNTACP